ncbi:MAG TPA: thioredoxin family protein [Flavobacteriaceae bacterium]|nr:thioredoxin family protein [Flavobacteriaceae bacterium]
MKKALIVTCLLALVSCGSQQTALENTEQNSENEVVQKRSKRDNITSPLLAKGNITKENLQKLTWYEPSVHGYNPDEAHVKELAKALKKHNYNIDVYFGTWCHDSRRVVPKFVNLLEKTGFDFSHVNFVSVNGRKEIPNVSPEIAAQLNVHRVPTIIFYENGKETERFVERAKESLVQDIIKIASGAEYLDSYE